MRVVYDEKLLMNKVKIPINDEISFRVLEILEDGWREREVCAQDLWYTKQPYKCVGSSRYYQGRNGGYTPAGRAINVYSKAYTLRPSSGSTGKIFYYENKVLRFTPRELMRLQTIPDWYKMASKHYRDIANIVGNGWTVDVIKHILSYL